MLTDPALAGGRRLAAAVKVAALLLPFLLFAWMAPFATRLSLGNDYQRFAIDQQLELMFSLEHGTFPLYVPGFAGGQSFTAMPQAEVLHPHAHAARLMPGYWQGQALAWNTLLRLVELGLAHLALVGLLLALGVRSLPAFAFSAATVYQLRMLDLFRYSAGLESWTGQLFLCAAIGHLWLSPRRRLSLAMVVGATYWLTCGGKTQFVLYALVSGALFAALFPFVAGSLAPPRRPVERREVARFWLLTAAAVGMGVLLSAAFLLPFALDFLPSNSERLEAGYAWVTETEDTVAGTLASFVLPLRSEVHGAFGGSSLLLVAALTPLLALGGLRPPRWVWLTAALVGLVLLYMLGSQTPFHRLVWEATPFGSALRYPGRLSQLLPTLLLLLLLWAAEAGGGDRRWRVGGIEVGAAGALAAAAALLTLIAVGFAGRAAIAIEPLRLTPRLVNPPPEWLESAALGAGLAALGALVLVGRVSRWRPWTELLLVAATLLQVGLTLRYGTWVTEATDKPTLAAMAEQKRGRLAYVADTPGYGLAPREVLRQAEESFLEPFLAVLYHRARAVQDLDQAYRVMARDRRPDEVVLEAAELPPPAGPASAPVPDRVELTWASFNRLVFAVSSSRPGYLGLAYPRSGGRWRATLDGRQVPLLPANGAAQALAVPAGTSRVEVRYHSRAATTGMVVSCATLALLGVLLAAGCRRLPDRLLVGVPWVALAAGLLWLWLASLNGGTSLGTRYRWEPVAPARLANLAYGRPTRAATSLFAPLYRYVRPPSAAVDGDRSPATGYVSRQVETPWWEVDLVTPQTIGSVLLYEEGADRERNLRPLLVALSADGEVWRTLEGREPRSPLRLVVEPPATARFVRVEASGVCRLSLDEVELYPPAVDSPTGEGR